jgi:transcriptional regulator with XRE-family HTH domain
MISPAQCRSARALLGWSVAKLASAASVSASAIDDFEAERRAPLPAVAGPIRRAFEPVGIAFLPGEDVRLRQGRCFEFPDVRPPSVYPDIEIWQGRIIRAQQFADLVNSYGGREAR